MFFPYNSYKMSFYLCFHEPCFSLSYILLFLEWCLCCIPLVRATLSLFLRLCLVRCVLYAFSLHTSRVSLCSCVCFCSLHLLVCLSLHLFVSVFLYLCLSIFMSTICLCLDICLFGCLVVAVSLNDRYCFSWVYYFTVIVFVFIFVSVSKKINI